MSCCWSNGGVGGAPATLPLTSNELPPGAYNADRGRKDGGTNADLAPKLGAGGRKAEDDPLKGAVEVEVELGVEVEGAIEVELGRSVQTGVGDGSASGT